MNCSKCGRTIMGEVKYCPYCGRKVEEQEIITEENVVKKSHENENIVINTENGKGTKKKFITDNVKEKTSDLWSKIDFFCKAEIVSMVIVIFLLFVAICVGKIIPILFAVIQLFGLVIALLLHKEKFKCDKAWIKYLIFALAMFITILNISSFFWFNRTTDSSVFFNSYTKVETPYSAEECIGKEKEMLIKDFRTAGFTNISEEKIEDLDVSEAARYGVVESVSINGVNNFEGNFSYKSSAKVIIKYHSFKSLEVPISSNEAKYMEVESILNSFEDVGFTNISLDEVFDIDPDVTNIEFENQILIDGSEDFDKGTKFPFNTEIKIVTHKPYTKYTLKIIVDFVPNLIFSKYDVEMKIDEETEILKHGKDGTFEYNVKEDTYTISFFCKEDSSVKESAEIDVTGDTEVAYKIICYNDYIDVETLYVENKGDIGENEVMVPKSASDCKYENFGEIKRIFQEAGFTNITTKILYDIVWGWTDEGEVEHVTIDGKKDFNRGDISQKGAEVIITYHMKEEDDPNRSVEVESDSNSVGEENRESILTVSNNEDFASIMKITDQTDKTTIKQFVNFYMGKSIEFDGCIALMMRHEKYNTRFDVCIVGGDYGPNRVYGPLFSFEDVNYYDMNVSGADRVEEKMNFCITAKIIGFNDEGNTIMLEPISLEAR